MAESEIESVTSWSVGNHVTPESNGRIFIFPDDSIQSD